MAKKDVPKPTSGFCKNSYTKVCIDSNLVCLKRMFIIINTLKVKNPGIIAENDFEIAGGTSLGIFIVKFLFNKNP